MKSMKGKGVLAKNRAKGTVSKGGVTDTAPHSLNAKPKSYGANVKGSSAKTWGSNV
jgi:hypothetical protein